MVLSKVLRDSEVSRDRDVCISVLVIISGKLQTAVICHSTQVGSITCAFAGPEE